MSHMSRSMNSLPGVNSRAASPGMAHLTNVQLAKVYHVQQPPGGGHHQLGAAVQGAQLGPSGSTAIQATDTHSKGNSSSSSRSDGLDQVTTSNTTRLTVLNTAVNSKVLRTNAAAHLAVHVALH
jgi:hypothetical protein